MRKKNSLEIKNLSNERIFSCSHQISITHFHDYPDYCAFQLSGILDINKIINNLVILRIKIFTLVFIERIYFVVLANLCVIARTGYIEITNYSK